MSMDLKGLIQKLNPECKKALEKAAADCLSRTHYSVEIEHWLFQIFDAGKNDFSCILQHFEIQEARLRRDISFALENLKTGNGSSPSLSSHLINLLRETWVEVSFQENTVIRSKDILKAMLSSDSLCLIANGISEELHKIHKEKISEVNYENSVENNLAKSDINSQQSNQPSGKQEALNRFTIDLTEKAEKGGIDPVIARENEVRQMCDILTRRRQNNPILTGEAGVGKTAVVEGFALRVAKGEVPEALKNIRVKALDLALLQAGAGIKGEFENRLKSVIEEVKSSPVPIVLFIDEAHNMVGAGGQAGQGDAANLLKPALARGELRTIAATTWAEYKKYFEKDSALTRRFQTVHVKEPSEQDAVEMMRGMKKTLEAHHGVRILDAAVSEAVKLSQRYIQGRQLPDKCLSLLDTACARVGLSQVALPGIIENVDRVLSKITTEIESKKKESHLHSDYSDDISGLEIQQVDLESRLEELKGRWESEKELSLQIKALLEKDTLTVEEAEQYSELSQQLSDIQGEEPMVHPCVSAQIVAEVVADWTQIPVGKMLAKEVASVLKLEENLRERVIGQDHALNRISQAILTSRAKMSDPTRPIGVFMLAGPSGVGKTETALALAEQLYGTDKNVTTINMSEYKEEHKVSLLLGSPPGYVGFGEGGVLTEAVRRQPYSIILLDEMEKAHPGVQEIFYQVFDKGMLKDGEGRDICFKNTIIIMTSNAGSDFIMDRCHNVEKVPCVETLESPLHEELLNTFKPAFLGRLNVIPYYPLTQTVLSGIIDLQLEKIKKRFYNSHKACINFSENVNSFILSKCTQAESGARHAQTLLRRSLLPLLSQKILECIALDKNVGDISVDVVEENFCIELLG